MEKKDIEKWLKEYRDAIRSMETDRWVGKFAEDATVEDPVGGPVHTGHDQLRAFFDGVRKHSKLLDMQPEFTVIAPPEAVIKFSVTNFTHSNAKIKFGGIGYYKFREDGKLIQMRAFWELKK
jgi:steroid delta-isomerase